MRWERLLMAVVVMAGLWPGKAFGQQPTLAEKGRAIAAERCAVCHATGRDDPSPQRIAPPFRDLDDRFPIDMLLQALRTGIIAGHDEMPMFELGAEGARALLAHIDSLSPTGLSYLEPPRR